MKKTLQILLGILFILVLAYFSFLEVSSKIKDDLLSKTKIQFIDKEIIGVTAEVEGEGLMLTRTLTLSGTVASEEEKIRVASLVEKIEGVARVDNQISVKVPTIKSVESTKSVISANDLNKEKISTKEGSPLKELVKSPVEAMVPIETNVKTPAVPKATQNIPKVPIPVEPIAAPIAVDTEKMIVDEKENRIIKTEGVK